MPTKNYDFNLTLISFLKKDYSVADNRSVNRYMYEMSERIPSLLQGAERTTINPLARLGGGKSFAGNLLSFWLGNGAEYGCAHNFYFNVGVRAKVKITTVYDIREFGGTPIEAWAARQWLKSDYLIAISTQTADELVARGYPRERVFTVNIGINDEFLTTPLPKKKKNSKSWNVGCISSFEKNKNILPIVETIPAYNIYMGTKPMVFRFYGPGGTEEKAIRRAAESALLLQDPPIIFGGFVPQDRMVATYDSFDAFIFPSLYEGFGMPIIEAQARGIPVVILKRAKIPNEVRKFCFEAEDEKDMVGILMGLEAGELFNAERRRAQMDYARTFTWDRCARQTVGIYRKIMAKSPYKNTYQEWKHAQECYNER